jgi:hypothetical protein
MGVSTVYLHNHLEHQEHPGYRRSHIAGFAEQLEDRDEQR